MQKSRDTSTTTLLYFIIIRFVYSVFGSTYIIAIHIKKNVYLVKPLFSIVSNISSLLCKLYCCHRFIVMAYTLPVECRSIAYKPPFMLQNIANMFFILEIKVKSIHPNTVIVHFMMTVSHIMHI